MTDKERSEELIALEDELLVGGVILSEWCSFLVREADTTYVAGSFLASILTSMSAIETHLRSELPGAAKLRLVQLIEGSGLDANLRTDLHALRKYRNRWVHVSDPWDDQDLIQNPSDCESELERMASFAIGALHRTVFAFPWV